jgi:hypothetical protein
MLATRAIKAALAQEAVLSSKIQWILELLGAQLTRQSKQDADKHNTILGLVNS